MIKIIVDSDGRHNFHNVPDITLHIADTNIIYNNGDPYCVLLTTSQIKRVRKHFCGMSGCCCDSHPVGWEEVDYNKVYIHI